MKLCQTQIQQALSQGKVLVFDEIDSTNEYLLTQGRSLPNGSLCLAESQSAGRGRRGRKWYAPKSDNLYFSMCWHYNLVILPQLPPLSLAVAVVIAETLQQFGVSDIQIKWPNDIYHQGKKMGGILNETRCDAQGVWLVVGIGLNLCMDQVDENRITQPWSDLSSYQLDRNQVAIALAQSLQQALADYADSGFSPYLSRWQSFDLFAQQAVRLVNENTTIEGIALGINAQGELLLQQENTISAFALGEFSLRKTETE